MDAIDWGTVSCPTYRPLSPDELSSYFARISLSGPYAPGSAALLVAVVHAHALAVPFESFDVTLRTPIDVSPRAIFDKLVVRQRGGYCLETNFLLLAALQALDFPVRLRAARVWMRCPEYAPRDPPVARMHVVLVARAGGAEFLCDVGFGGGGPSTPLPLRAGLPPEDAGGDCFHVRTGDAALGEDTFVLFGVQAGEFRRLYSFEHEGWDAPTVHAADFIPVNFFVQSARGSLFHTICVANLPLPEGRVTLLGRELRVKGAERPGAAPRVAVTRIGDAREYRALALDHFGVALSEAQANALFEWATKEEEAKR